MTVLAFDCCLSAVSVAVMTGDRIVLKQERMTGGQAEHLMPVIEQTLQDAGIPFAQVELLAVTLGPGGFTSVRVGMAAARGLALALGIPVVGQSTLEALAAAAIDLPVGIERIVATIPAGRGGIYAQSFDRQARSLSAARVIEADAIAFETLEPDDAIVGPAAHTLAAGRANLILPDLLPRADILARSAKHLTRDGELRPIYLRAADAKPQIGKALPRA